MTWILIYSNWNPKQGGVHDSVVQYRHVQGPGFHPLDCINTETKPQSQKKKKPKKINRPNQTKPNNEQQQQQQND